MTDAHLSRLACRDFEHFPRNDGRKDAAAATTVRRASLPNWIQGATMNWYLNLLLDWTETSPQNARRGACLPRARSTHTL